MAFDLKDYVDVAERLREFYEKHPQGRVITAIVEMSDKRVVVRAEVYRGAEQALPSGIGHSQLSIPGSTPYTRGAELENAETSAVGRALVMAGLASKRIASADEVAAKRTPSGAPSAQSSEPESDVIYQAAEAIFGDDLPAPQKPAIDPNEALRSAVAFAQSATDGSCAKHGKPWSYKPGGVSKTSGKPYGGFYACAGRDEDGWCREKPKASWVAAQGAA
jgi:hypothetical protein